MAWLYQRDGSQNWWIGWRIGGKQFLKSTRTAKKAEAQKQLDQFEVLAIAKRTGGLTQDFVNALTGNAQPKVTLKTALESWLAFCKGAVSPGTHERYSDVQSQLLDYFKADPLLSEIAADELQAFLSDRLKHRSVGSVNLTRKILSVFFGYAVGRGFTTSNPVKATRRFKVAKAEKKKRQPFSLEELGKTIKAAPDAFWKYMTVGATYTGLSLGDLIVLRVSEIDPAHKELVLERGKTGVAMHIPIAGPVRAQLTARLATRTNWKPNDYLWPQQAAKYLNGGGKPNAGPFSKDFYEKVLMKAGLAEKRSHKRKKRSDADHGRRSVSRLSFHSYRHAFVSMLKLSGASQAVAKQLAGHSSDAISDLYTSLPPEILTKAIAQLPEVTS
jgi:integrase